MYDGKRSARMRLPSQVNMDPQLYADIIADADRDRRAPGLHVVVLLTEAMVARNIKRINETVGTRPPDYAQQLTLTHGATPKSAESHVNTRRKAANE